MLAHSLFEGIVYDIDGRQIIDFTVKAWAEPFLIYRADLLVDDGTEEAKNRLSGVFSNDVLSLDPNGASGRKTVFERLVVAKHKILAAIHVRFRVTLSGNRDRDVVLKVRYLAGETLSALALEFGLMPQCVFQPLNRFFGKSCEERIDANSPSICI